ncbi:aldehyde ferredoxin oxidoreductase C-terminal domain-containing protein [Thauera aromatica]|uniref:Putative aldehyde:ferredoxin oxidoreductase n=1 Tax=Thauera aromatica K172 TaxID=44139 RepID=A0A2R4BLX6_THAAR|nr:aldehyde ferredoxin oxidoreductase C-terminal domain-containing protein [Thauera aromatica]AVR88203.1 putative aldehyde:ferredoxin oxidoreductase [Thauera aromatica K172]
MKTDIRNRVERLLARMEATPQYPGQGKVLFVDLEQRTLRSAYLPMEIVRTFLGGRGANMMLLYNLFEDGRQPLEPEVPLVFGVGIMTTTLPSATRGNFTSCSPDSHAILDASGGDYFPAFLKRNGYDHLVIYGRSAQWTMLEIDGDTVSFRDAAPYVGMDNIDFTTAIERDLGLKEREDLAMARITRAGENLVLSAGIMGGPKAIWARGGGGAKMGSLQLKAILVRGKGRQIPTSKDFKLGGKAIGQKILATSVIQNALKKVGTPFLYKPSRALGAIGTKNNQETTWHETLDADNFDPYRPGMDGCYLCPVQCRAMNDLTPEGKGGWGASALKGLTGNASYDKAQAEVEHHREKTYKGIRGDGKFDKYDHGDGPEYVTVGKFGPNLGIREPEQVLRLNNILNDLGMDSASAGGAIGWAMELFQRGILTAEDTGGLDLSWGNYPVIEQLLFMTSRRQGFGDVIADDARAVENGKYPPAALDYRMSVKGLFQSDPHDARILKAFALGLAVATRGMDHLRNRVTLEINARVNDDPEFKTALYGGFVAAEPNSYIGKEYAVRRCENTFAVGDSIGMCRFNTKLFNSPSLPDLEDFRRQLNELVGLDMSVAELEECGRNIIGIERLMNYRLGLRASDDTLPRRWFEEPIQVGPFKGEKIDRNEFEALKARFYEVTGLDDQGIPKPEWHEHLARVATGFAVRVALPGSPTRTMVLDEPVENVAELRTALARRLGRDAESLHDRSLNVALDGRMVLSGEAAEAVHNGSNVSLVPALAGG